MQLLDAGSLNDRLLLRRQLDEPGLLPRRSAGDARHPNLRQSVVPQEHPIFDSFFRIDLKALVSYGSGGTPAYFGLFRDNDPTKRIMMIVNFNQDMGDYWEWSDRGFNVVPTNEAYKLGVNYLIYALTH